MLFFPNMFFALMALVVIACVFQYVHSKKEEFEEMHDYFKNMTFSPSCCPSNYSSDRGCACESLQQKNSITSRGRNSTYCGSRKDEFNS